MPKILPASLWRKDAIDAEERARLIDSGCDVANVRTIVEAA